MMKESTIRTGVHVLLVAAFASLLLYWPAILFPSIVGKMIVFRTAIEIAFALYVWLLVRDYERYKPVLNGITIALVLFGAVLGVAAVFGLSLYHSFWGTLDRMDGLFSYVHYVLLYVVVTGVYKDKESWLRLCRVFIIMASVLGGLALYGYVWRHDIAFVSGNQAFLAQALVFSVYLAVFLLVEVAAKGLRRVAPWAWFGLAFFALIMLFTTAIRGAMLGMIGGIGLGVAWYALRNPRRTIRYGAIGLIIAGVCAITGIFALKDSPIIIAIRPLERLSNLSLADASVSTRLNAWQTAVRAIQDRPILGWGPEQYQAAFNTHFNPAFLSSVGESIWFDKAHNIVLDIAVSSGLVGLAAYLMLIGVAFRACWRYYRLQPLRGIILTCALVSYIIFNLTLFDTMYSLIPFMLLLAGLSAISKNNEEQPKHTVCISPRIIRSTGIGIAGIMIFLGLYGNVLLYPTVVAARDAQVQSLAARPFVQIANTLEPALRRPVYASRDIGVFSTQILDGYISDDAVATSKRFHDSAASVAHVLERARQINPHDLKTMIALMSVYSMQQQFDKAEAVYDSMVAAFPTIPNVYFHGAVAAITAGRNDEAVERGRAGLALNEESGSSHWQYGVVLALTDHTEEALAEFERSMERNDFHPKPEEAFKVALTYRSMGDAAKTTRWYEISISEAYTLIKHNRDSVSTNITYIQALLANIQVETAQERLDFLLENRPAWADELKAFVESLGVKSEVSNDSSDSSK